MFENFSNRIGTSSRHKCLPLREKFFLNRIANGKVYAKYPSMNRIVIINSFVICTAIRKLLSITDYFLLNLQIHKHSNTHL